MHRFILLIALLSFTIACGSAGPGDFDVMGDWQLVSGSVDGQSIPLIEDSPVTLNLDGTEVGGTAGCNTYGAQLVLDGESISISDLTTTLMACAPEIMAVETPFTAALPEVDTVSLDGDELVLTGPDIELRFAAMG